MRFYPTTDVNFFYDIPPLWSRYCRSPRKSWKRKPPLQRLHTMFVYRDLQGALMARVLQKDLYFTGGWPTTRVRREACLPNYYGVGGRFIRLERAPPLGFKCSPMPISFKEVEALNAYHKKLAKEEARLLKLQESAKKDRNEKSQKKKRKK